MYLMELGVIFGLLGGLLLALEAGYRLGQQAVKEREAPKGPHVGAMQGALLGLLGLLLGFSFAGASTRFMERQDLISEEANAIGTVYLRADLLNEPYRADLKREVAAYAEHRVLVSKHLQRGISPARLEEIVRFHDTIWTTATQGADATPGTMIAVLNPVNDMLDLHSSRIAAGQKHLPALVLALLIISAALANLVIGYGFGTGGRRWLPMTASLAVLMAIALWTIIDLDHPRVGAIRLSDAPLQNLHRSLNPQPDSTE